MEKLWPLITVLLTVASSCSQPLPKATEPAADREQIEPIEETFPSALTEGNPTSPVPEAATVSDATSGVRLLPVDEGANNESFNNFRQQLIAAVENKDTEFLLAIVHPDIQNSFGRSNGIENFKQRWNIEAADSQLWAELADVLKLGGTFEGTAVGENADTFVAPYVFTRFPTGYSPVEYAAVIASDVALRAEPATDAEIVAVLSYHIVLVDRSQPAQAAAHADQVTWVKVATTEGQAGYVAEQYIRRPTDYRAFFENHTGDWKMTFFAAGD